MDPDVLKALKGGGWTLNQGAVLILDMCDP